MTVEEIKKFIKELGLPVVLVGYYIYKDYMFTEKMIVMLTKFQTSLEQIEALLRVLKG